MVPFSVKTISPQKRLKVYQSLVENVNEFLIRDEQAPINHLFDPSLRDKILYLD
jgi:hypothetical protein